LLSSAGALRPSQRLRPHPANSPRRAHTSR
jgi:hypothetical protein